MITILPAQITPVNSTSYIDMLGVLIGIDRLPGEAAADFARRLQLAVASDRGPTYTGMVNELVIEFGLETYRAIEVSKQDGSPFDLVVLFGALTLDGAAVPLFTISEDGFWEWLAISDVAAAIDQLSGYRASLEGADGPAFLLVAQANGATIVAESLAGCGQSVKLGHAGVVASSIRFNADVPAYTLAGSVIHFVSQPPDNIQVTYRYRVCPYDVVASPAALYSLSSPDVRAAAALPDGTLTHQAQEYLQEILARDGSYWGA